MSSFTDYTENLVLDWLLTGGAATRPTAWHVGAFTAAPSDAGGGTEVTGGAYARVAVTFSITGNAATNSAAVEFPTATAAWGTVTHLAVFDAATSGNMLAWAALDTSKAIALGDTLRISTGDLEITLT